MTVGADYLLLILLGIALLLLGGLLLVLALRGVRHGSMPHCRRCAYNLTGLTTNACPECGATCDERGVAWGARQRSGLAIAGATTVLLIGVFIGGTAGYLRYKQGNPYRYYPHFMLVSIAQADTTSAVAELLRRCQAGGLSAGRADELAEIALKKQAAVTQVPATQDWIDILLALHAAKQLSDAQKDAFFAQMAAPILELRPFIRVGEPMPYRIRCTARTPSIGLYAGLDCTRVEIGGKWKDDCHSNLRFQAIGNSGSVFATIELGSAPPGIYPVRCLVQQPVFQGAVVGGRDGPMVWSRETELVGEIEILPHDAPDPITMIDDPALADAIRDAIDIGAVSASGGGDSMSSLHAMIHTGTYTIAGADLPMDVAFDVRIRLSIGEFDFGPLTGQPGTNNGMGIFGTTPPFLDQTATIILRASTDVARKTVDLDEIWDGELVFENVPVQHAVVK